MEEDASSMIEDTPERSSPTPSQSSSDAGKQPRNIGGGSSSCGEVLSVKFKGVVSQPNGHWGAQIYANHQRIWLGTFKSEIEAAMAYDSASTKLRITGDNYRNIPWTNTTIHEPKFQSFHSPEAILNMIRNGSYPSRFAEFLKSQSGEKETGFDVGNFHGHAGFSCKLLFQKELTPSDVGKLNRLVIPKKYAVRYFPGVAEEDKECGKVDEVHLFFYDGSMRLWKFRYCYWKSSQSFVFTRGWNRFVKEKGLKANDIIGFYICEGKERGKEGQSFIVIDVGCAGGSRNTTVDQGGISQQNIDVEANLPLRLGQNLNFGFVKEETEKEFEEQKEMGTRLGPTPRGEKRVRLFGVEIR
ncbi:hypothetical protein U1Q18_049430 [Sarracenia purpurea var. burkii]